MKSRNFAQSAFRPHLEFGDSLAGFFFWSSKVLPCTVCWSSNSSCPWDENRAQPMVFERTFAEKCLVASAYSFSLRHFPPDSKNWNWDYYDFFRLTVLFFWATCFNNSRSRISAPIDPVSCHSPRWTMTRLCRLSLRLSRPPHGNRLSWWAQFNTWGGVKTYPYHKK